VRDAISASLDLDTLFDCSYHPGGMFSRAFFRTTDLHALMKRLRNNVPFLLAFAALCGASLGASAQSPTQSKSEVARLVVTGDVQTPLSLSLSDLAALPRKTLKVTNEHEKKEETYQGVPLAEILKRAGVPQGERMRGRAFGTYVRADAADGYSVIFSLGELDSSIQDLDVLVADTLDGQPIPDKVGPLRLVVPHDKRPARWVRMLVSITVVKASH
jgi:DMSO/TMAO reductase YedYZ molybdopterin-dependent catalytic subunit